MAIGCISNERMVEFLSGDLSAEDETIVGAHLQECESCDRVARALSEAPVARQLLTLVTNHVEPQPHVSLVELKNTLLSTIFFSTWTPNDSSAWLTISCVSCRTGFTEV